MRAHPEPSDDRPRVRADAFSAAVGRPDVAAVSGAAVHLRAARAPVDAAEAGRALLADTEGRWGGDEHGDVGDLG